MTMQAATELGHVHSVETGCVQRVESLLRKPGLFVHGGGMRSDLLLAQRPNRRPQFVVFLGQPEHIERRITSHHSLLATRG
jgi:hypothetical protein